MIMDSMVQLPRKKKGEKSGGEHGPEESTE